MSNDGEDAASIAQHHLFIASECEKLRPNWEAVKSSMERTVSAHSAVMESSTTAEIVSHYSWITIPKLVIAVKYSSTAQCILSSHSDNQHKVVRTLRILLACLCCVGSIFVGMLNCDWRKIW